MAGEAALNLDTCIARHTAPCAMVHELNGSRQQTWISTRVSSIESVHGKVYNRISKSSRVSFASWQRYPRGPSDLLGWHYGVSVRSGDTLQSEEGFHYPNLPFSIIVYYVIRPVRLAITPRKSQQASKL